MNPEHGQLGCDPHSNKILDTEKAMIEAKQEKCGELIKQNGEIFDTLNQAKTDKNVLAMTGGRELDVNSVTNLLFSDGHFVSMLGNLLQNRPPTKKVEQFFSNQVSGKIDNMVLDSKIQGKFKIQSSVFNDVLVRLQINFRA